jgi:bifunctional DNA-binding transcriptional regulator/antitoxin component of YhaV-PrlF toxin-antitoxin module
MLILKVTARRQISLGKDVLKHLGVKPGGKINYELLPDGTVMIEAAEPSATTAPSPLSARRH